MHRLLVLIMLVTLCAGSPAYAQQDPQEVFDRGVAAVERNDLDAARAAFEETQRIQPQFAPGRLALDALKDHAAGTLDQKALLAMAKGIRAASAQELDAALEAFAAVAVSQPKYARVHALIANVNVLKRDYPRAIAEYNAAVNLNPGAAGLYHDRGITFATMGEYDRALKDLSRAVEIDPLYKMAYFYRGNAYSDMQRYDEALADYTKVIELDPQFIDAYLNRGSLYLSEKDMAQDALADFSAAIKIDSKNADAFYNRGVVYASLKDFEKALGDFTISYLLDPRNSDAFFAKARIYEEQGKPAEAVAMYREFIGSARPGQEEYVQVARQRLAIVAGAQKK